MIENWIDPVLIIASFLGIVGYINKQFSGLCKRVSKIEGKLGL